MRRIGIVIAVSIVACAVLFPGSTSIALAGELPAKQYGPRHSALQVAQASPESHQPPSNKSGTSVGGESLEDILLNKGTITMDEWIKIKAEEEYRGAGRDFRLDAIENFKTNVESLPILTDKVNFGLNALQWLYTHQDAHVPEGKSQDNISIRRSEFLFWGKINDTIPRWHALYEFQSINFGSSTPNIPTGTGATGTPASATFFRESYLDFRPFQSWAPNLNYFRLGIFRMPFGIFTETSGGLRDVISSPYLTSVGSGNGISNGTAGTIDFIQERDFFLDARGKIANRLEYAVGIMNNNNFHANATGSNQPKAFYSRARLFGTDVSFVSFTTILGESNNAGTNINGRGKGAFDRWAIDGRYTSKLIPGFLIQGEWWQGHDGANQTTVGRGANGACQVTAICGGSGAPGVQRRTWYVLAKYLINDGLFQNWEPTVMHEQFDPSTSTSNDLYTRTILGLTYYFENFPPKVQSKIQFNYEFRHHQGNGPGVAYDSTFDAFAKNAFLVQFQIRFM